MVSPHPDKIEPGSARELAESFRRMFVRIFGRDLLTGLKIKLMTGEMDCLIGVANEIDLDSTLG